jgi:hypothetical protein
LGRFHRESHRIRSSFPNWLTSSGFNHKAAKDRFGFRQHVLRTCEKIDATGLVPVASIFSNAIGPSRNVLFKRFVQGLSRGIAEPAVFPGFGDPVTPAQELLRCRGRSVARGTFGVRGIWYTLGPFNAGSTKPCRNI